jgi:SAM-dependent methyltransferase
LFTQRALLHCVLSAWPDKTESVTDPHASFPPGFFSRADESPDDVFYVPDRFVTHIDDRAIAAVGALYRELGLTGSVLDIMSSWISHFLDRPNELVAMGMNQRELARNEMTHEVLVQDLNVDQRLPFDDGRFDAVTCCVSVDYLTRPIDVLLEASRVLKPGGIVVCTFSNRCFPTKAIRGWLSLDENARCELVAQYLKLAGFTDVTIALRTPPNTYGDPLYAVTGRARYLGSVE